MPLPASYSTKLPTRAIPKPPPRGGSLGSYFGETSVTPKVTVEVPMPANPKSSALGFPERGIGFTEPPRPQKPINYVEIPIDRGLPVPGAGSSARVPQTRPPARVPAPAGNPYGGGGAYMGIAGPLGMVADQVSGQYNETYQRYERWKQYGLSTEQFFKLPKDVRDKILRGEAPLIRPDLNDAQWQEYLDKLGEIKRGKDEAYRQWVEEQERKRKEFQEWKQKQEAAKGRPPYKDDPYNDDSRKSPFQGNSPYNPKNIPPGDSRNPNDPGSWWNPDNPASPFNRDNPNNPWDKNDPMNPGNPNSPLNPKNPNSPYNPNNPDSPYHNPPPFENGTPGGLPGGGGDQNVMGTWTVTVRAVYFNGTQSPPFTYSIPGTAGSTFGSRTIGDCIAFVQNSSIMIDSCFTKISNGGQSLNIVSATFQPAQQPQPKPDPQTSPPPFPPPAQDPDGKPDPKAPPIPAPANPPAGLPSPPPTPAGKPALDPGQTPTPAPKPAPAPELPRLPNWQPSPLPPMAPPQRQPGTAPGTGTGSGVGASGSPQQQWNQTPSEIIEREPLRTPGLGLLPGIDPNTGRLIRPGTKIRMPPSNFQQPFDTPFDAPLPNPGTGTGGGGGTGTGTGEGNPFPCRYKEDELALVKVQKVQVALNGRQRVEQDLSVHEKMTDFAALHFSQMADIKAGVDRLEKGSKINRALQAVDTIMTVHNAAMLSRELLETAGDAASAGLTVIARMNDLIDPEEVIDVNEILGKQITEWIKEIIGNDVWNDLSRKWQAANRIYQSSANLLNAVRSLHDSTQALAQESAERIGIVANALRRDGVVSSDSYAQMSEQVVPENTLIKRLEQLNDAADAVYNVVSDVQSVQEAATDLAKAKEEFEKAMAEKAKGEKTLEDAAKLSDKTPDFNEGDFNPA